MEIYIYKEEKQMKKKKMQRAISTLLLCAVVNTTTPAGYNNLGTVFASLTSANEQITFGESIFNVSFEKDSGSAPSDITISPSNLNTGEVKYPTFLQTEKLVKNKASKWSEKMVLGKKKSKKVLTFLVCKNYIQFQ